ncbi:MAG: efflux RND transporter permease subunit [Oscillospiraceae bacterium]|jgi:predicted RND superfamily exporter protein
MKFARGIVKIRVWIVVIALLLLIPSIIGYEATKVNYDVLVYLPEDMDTMKGQEILEDEFGTGAYSLVVCEGMSQKELAKLETQLEGVDHVNSVIWYGSVLGESVPVSMIPDSIYSKICTGEDTLMFVTFDTTTSADETMDAIHEIRRIAGERCFISGMSAIVTDTKDLADKEVIIYVTLAVALALAVSMLTMDSYIVPVIILISIGIAIVYNMGTNIMLGEISYLTKAIAAVLQLGVTMDYSIFLWHSYEENLEKHEDHREAMAFAIHETFQSVLGSSITTIAGFIALCFMSFTLGRDLGIVMAKGVVFGVIACVTVLPSLLLVLDKLVMKTRHKALLPSMKKVSDWIVKDHYKLAILMLVLMVAFGYFQAHTEKYYNLDSSLPDDLPSVQANTKLSEDFNFGATHMALIDKDTPESSIYKMIDEMEEVDGVEGVLCLESIKGPAVPDSMIPDDIKDALESDDYKLMVILNRYATASDEVNAQITDLISVIKEYDEGGMLIGEAPATKDLITITDHDFTVVSIVSIGLVFLIIMFVFKSISLPVILVAVIETAIFVNLGIPYFTHNALPFIANIVISTIQLGATVDYGILITSRYEKERIAGKGKKDAISIAHAAGFRSVLVSGLTFFAATFGVGLYSNIDMISSLCTLMARGALISMFMVLLCLPSLLWIFDGVIIRTSLDMRRALISKKKKGSAEGNPEENNANA